MGQKNSFSVLRVNDKMTEIRVQRARICALVRNRGTARYFYLSLSLYVSAVRVSLLLFVRRCGGEKEAFIVLSVRY